MISKILAFLTSIFIQLSPSSRLNPVVMVTSAPTPVVALSSPVVVLPTPVVSEKPVVATIKTPTLSVSASGYQVTARAGETIRLSTVRPMKGTKVTGVSFSSNFPGVVSMYQIPEDQNAAIYLKINKSISVNSYNWDQKITVSFDAGYTRDFTYGVKLKIIQ